MSEPALHNRPFTWPPAPGVATSGAKPHFATGATSAPSTCAHSDERLSLADRARCWWRTVESAWLDPTALPLAQRAEEACWAPDTFAQYCDRCGHTIGPHEAGEFGCSACADSRPPWARFVRLGDYEAPLSDWICEVKFQRFRTLGSDLGRVLARQIRESCAGIDLSARAAVVVPVPTTLRRRAERGIDHAGVIAQAVATELGIPLRRALARNHRPSQRAVPASDRAGNVSGSMRLARVAFGPGSFRFRSGLNTVKSMNVILIDDVMTTGATLRAASRAVGQARSGGQGPTMLIAAVLAVTPDPDRRARQSGPQEPVKSAESA